MQANEYVEIFISIGDKIDMLWNMFIFLHIGIFGYFISADIDNVCLSHKIMSLVCYSIFSYINGKALVDTYDLASLAIQDIVGNIKVGQGMDNILSFFVTYNLDNRHAYVYLIHTIAGVGVAFMLKIWRVKKQGTASKVLVS